METRRCPFQVYLEEFFTEPFPCKGMETLSLEDRRRPLGTPNPPLQNPFPAKGWKRKSTHFFDNLTCALQCLFPVRG